MLKSSRSDYTEDLGMITNELVRMDSALKMISMMYKGTGILTHWSNTSVVSGVEDFALVIEPDLQLALDAEEVMVGAQCAPCYVLNESKIQDIGFSGDFGLFRIFESAHSSSTGPSSIYRISSLP